jgi:hypothetical protein
MEKSNKTDEIQKWVHDGLTECAEYVNGYQITALLLISFGIKLFVD